MRSYDGSLRTREEECVGIPALLSRVEGRSMSDPRRQVVDYPPF